MGDHRRPRSRAHAATSITGSSTISSRPGDVAALHRRSRFSPAAIFSTSTRAPAERLPHHPFTNGNLITPRVADHLARIARSPSRSRSKGRTREPTAAHRIPARSTSACRESTFSSARAAAGAEDGRRVEQQARSLDMQRFADDLASSSVRHRDEPAHRLLAEPAGRPAVPGRGRLRTSKIPSG